MMLKIIMMVCFAPLVPILYAMLRNESKFKKNIMLGVTLPYEAREDPAVADAGRRFKKWLGIICGLLLLFQIPFYFIPSAGVFMLVYMIWMILIIVLPYIPFLHYHRQLQAYKKAKGWASSRKGSVAVDLHAAAEDKRSLSAWWFFPPVVFSVIPMIMEATTGDNGSWAFVLVYLLLTLMVASFYLFYRMINRQRADVVEENTALNRTLTRIRRYNWSKMWLWMAWLTGAFNFFLWLLIGNWAALMVMLFLYITLILLVAMQTEFTARKAQYKLTLESGQGSYVDDDQYWPHGIFYYNPNDKHLIINNRTGIGTTMNLGRPAGKLVLAFGALVIALLPLAGVWMVIEEAAPLAIEVTGQEIIATHTGSYHVALDTVQGVELLEDLPAGSVRLVGTGMDNLSKGKWRVPDIGPCELNLDPTIGPFLLLYTEEGTYLFGTRSPDQTVAAYDAIWAARARDL